MKKIFMVACMLTFAFMISAQGGQGGGGQRQGGGQGGGFQQSPERIAQNQERMKTELKLNDKQFADYKKIDEEMRKKQADVRQNAAGDREKMQAENLKLRTEQNEKMKKILTADQFKKYEELMAQQQQRGQGGGGGNRQN